MATGQTLLNYMELANQELQLQPNENDVVRGLLALNVAQDYFENLASSRKVKTGSTSPTAEVATSAAGETTAFPTGCIRVDRIWRLDGTGGNPVAELEPLKRTGGHRQSFNPWLTASSVASGSPTGWWTQGSYIYWSPLPSGVTYCRLYGFMRAADITASGTFTYDDGVMFPIAGMAARLMAIGVADPTTDLTGLANEYFEAILDTLERFNRDGGQDLTYTRIHRE